MSIGSWVRRNKFGEQRTPLNGVGLLVGGQNARRRRRRWMEAVEEEERKLHRRQVEEDKTSCGGSRGKEVEECCDGMDVEA